MVLFKSRKRVGQERPKIGPSSQILAIEKEIRETPYHKGTERHIGLLRARLAKLRDQESEASSKKSGGGGYAVKKQGDATIVLVGPPSVGKSTLLNKLTNAKSKVAPYAFTTLTVIPGMMKYKDANIQILDVPGLIKGAEEGKGRGREVLSVVRGADLIIIMCDPKNIDAIKSITEALERNGVRINKNPPDISIDKKPGGGMIIHSNIKQEISSDTVKDIASQFGIRNGEITFRERVTLDKLIDSFAKNRVYIPAILVINKSDQIKNRNKFIDSSEKYLFISATRNEGLDALRETIWKILNFSSVYLVKDDELPNKNNPIVTKSGQTLGNIAQKIGSEFAKSKNKAKIWGNGAKYEGQEVSLSTKVQEGMMVRFE